MLVKVVSSARGSDIPGVFRAGRPLLSYYVSHEFSAVTLNPTAQATGYAARRCRRLCPRFFLLSLSAMRTRLAFLYAQTVSVCGDRAAKVVMRNMWWSNGLPFSLPSGYAD